MVTIIIINIDKYMYIQDNIGYIYIQIYLYEILLYINFNLFFENSIINLLNEISILIKMQ